MHRQVALEKSSLAVPAAPVMRGECMHIRLRNVAHKVFGSELHVKALFNRTVSCKLSKGQIISGCVCVVDWSTPPDDYLPF